MKTVKMIFNEDKTVDGQPFAAAGEVVEVAETSVERWLKRGGKIAEEVVKAAETEQGKHNNGKQKPANNK